MNQWINENLPTVIALCTMLGGFVAHIRAYEKSPVVFTLKQHISGLVIKTTYAFFIAILLYFAAIGLKWEVWTICIVGCLCGLHGTELLDWSLTLLKEKATKFFGLNGGDK